MTIAIKSPRVNFWENLSRMFKEKYGPSGSNTINDWMAIVNILVFPRLILISKSIGDMVPRASKQGSDVSATASASGRRPVSKRFKSQQAD